jgi:RNA polymerase sporulation-specific sigma factor
MTDETLVKLAREGDAAALETLLVRHKGLVRAKAGAYFLSGGERDDLLQEGMIGLYKAVLDFSDEKNSSFAAFAALCISRQILTAIKTATRHKHSPLNSSLTLENADEAHEPLSDPELLFISRESSNDIAAFIHAKLSEMERSVLFLYMQGMTHADIAAALGKKTKVVDNTLQRVRKKIKARGSV